MIVMKIGDSKIAAYSTGSNYIVPVFTDKETPTKVFYMSEKEFWIFIQSMCYVEKRQKINVSDYVRRLKVA